jgi:hypothetical protein
MTDKNEDPTKGINTVLSTCANIQVSDIGVKFTFGEMSTDKEPVYHTSVFLPTMYVSMFEKHYKDCVDQYLAAKAKQKNAV